MPTALAPPTADAPARPARPAPWWHARRDDLLALAAEGTPVYAYSAATMRRQAERLLALGVFDRVLYAIKANAHPDVLHVLRAAGLAFECVSPGEVAHVQRLFPDLAPERVLFTPNFVPRAEYEGGFAAGVRVTVDNLYPLEAWPEAFAGRDVFVRLDPGTGRGHHAHVRTAGARSKFGVALDDLDRLARAVQAAGARVVGLHAHVGSGVGETGAWAETARILGAAAAAFPDVRVLDIGGGLPVPDGPDAPRFDLDRAAALLREAKPEGLELWAEPGRFLVAEAGVLLCRVTQTKRKGGVRYVGLDAGMHTLVRPALYGARHPIANLSRLGAPDAGPVEVVGMICESGDAFGHDVRLPETREGDVVAIATAGAYGAAMQSRYNLREPAREIVLG